MVRRMLVVVLILLMGGGLFAQDAPKTDEPFMKVDVYGALWFYGWYNTARFVGQEVVIRTLAGDYKALGMSGTPTRVGVKVNFPGIKCVNASGLVEIDFAGNYAASGAAEAQSMPRLRHALININNGGKTLQYGTIIGSTWSIVSPLFPSLINPGAGWAMGNLWQRMPQVQLFLNSAFGKSKAGAKLALTRSMTGSSLYKNTQVFTDIDGGDASGVPQFQGEAYVDLCLGEKIKLYASVSGAYGVEDFEASTVTNTTAERLDVKVVAASLRLSAGPLTISGEFYTGSNIDIFGAQFGQAVVGNYSDAYSTMGFWGEAGVKITSWLSVMLGYGLDNPENTGGASYYNLNTAMWGTVAVSPFKNYSISVCVIQLKTEYGNGTKASGLSCMFDSKLVF